MNYVSVILLYVFLQHHREGAQLTPNHINLTILSFNVPLKSYLIPYPT